MIWEGAPIILRFFERFTTDVAFTSDSPQFVLLPSCKSNRQIQKLCAGSCNGSLMNFNVG